MDEKIELIIEWCLKMNTDSPIDIFLEIANNECINLHGPEHHFLNGACILTAYHQLMPTFDLKEALEKLAIQAKKMPGAMCGLWGVCGAVSSVGAALAIIDGTGPLSEDGSWGDHMTFTSKTIEKMGKINGPRCCKRDGVLSLLNAIEYLKEHKKIELKVSEYHCPFSKRNKQCITTRCPYYNH